MGLYLNFEGYTKEKIQERPMRLRTVLRDYSYIYEISYNRMTEGLVLKIYADDADGTLITTMNITANLDLTALIADTIFPRNIAIFGQWIKQTDKQIADAFMNEFKLYVGFIDESDEVEGTANG